MNAAARAAAAICLAVPIGAAADIGTYRLQDISAGGTLQFAVGIDNGGGVLAESWHWAAGGYYTSPATGVVLLTDPTVPGVPPNTVPNTPRGADINAQGVITGTWYPPGEVRAFRYTPGGGMRDLGRSGIEANGTDDAGHTVGRFRGGTGRDYFIADPDGNLVVHTAPVPLAGITGLRNDGVIVGNRQHATDSERPVAGLLENGTWRDLASSGAYSSHPMGFNEQGAVVGMQAIHSATVGVPVQHAFAYTPEAGVVDLVDAMPWFNHFSTAAAVNEQGLVVGYGARGDTWETFSFLHDLTTGQLVDLASVLLPGTAAGWTNMYLVDVNDAGQIAGWGQFGGESRAFLLSPAAPVPEPAGLLMMALGAALVAGVARRRVR